MAAPTQSWARVAQGLCATSPCRAGLGILWPPARPTLGVTPVRSASRVAAARQSISCRGLDVV